MSDISIRTADSRGGTHIGWLDSFHTFSFGSYYDPKHMGYGVLRVINDDKVAPGGGFATHPHKDMEIISYVMDGALEHKDSMGNGSVIRPGDVQRMSAGTGVTHSEFNHSKTEPVHFLQIWFLPDRNDHQPGYEQKHFNEPEKRGRFRLLASADGHDDSVSLNQDINMYAALLHDDEAASFQLEAGRRLWVQAARGSFELNGQRLDAGDGAAIEQSGYYRFANGEQAEIILFELPGE